MNQFENRSISETAEPTAEPTTGQPTIGRSNRAALAFIATMAALALPETAQAECPEGVNVAELPQKPEKYGEIAAIVANCGDPAQCEERFENTCTEKGRNAKIEHVFRALKRAVQANLRLLPKEDVKACKDFDTLTTLVLAKYSPETLDVLMAQVRTAYTLDKAIKGANGKIEGLTGEVVGVKRTTKALKRTVIGSDTPPVINFRPEREIGR